MLHFNNNNHSNYKPYEPVCAHAHPVPFMRDVCLGTGQLVSAACQILLVQVKLFLSLTKTRLRLPASLFFQLQLLLQPRDAYTQPLESKSEKE